MNVASRITPGMPTTCLATWCFFQLERHSDHHANSSRRYQSLRNFDDIPELPNGYFGMYLLAYVPVLWFRVMDKRLLELPHIRGDLSKVNRGTSGLNEKTRLKPGFSWVQSFPRVTVS